MDIDFKAIERMAVEKTGFGIDEVYFFDEVCSKSLWYTCMGASLEYPTCPIKRKRTAETSASPGEMIVQVPTLPPIVAHLPHLRADLQTMMTEGHNDMVKFTDMCNDEHFMGLNVLDIYHKEPRSATSSGAYLYEKLPTHFNKVAAGFDRDEMNRIMVAIAELHSFVLHDHGHGLLTEFKRQEPAGLIAAMKETIKFVIAQKPLIFGNINKYQFLDQVLTEEEAAMVRNPEERGMPLVVVHRDITPQSVGLLQMSNIRSLFDPCLPAIGSPAEDCAIAFALGMELPKYRNKHSTFLERYHKKLIRNTGRKGFHVPYDLSKFRMEFRRVFPYASCYAVFTLMNHAVHLRESCPSQNASTRDGIMEEAELLLKRAARVLEAANRRFTSRDAYEAHFGLKQMPSNLNRPLENDDNDFASDSSCGEDEDPVEQEVFELSGDAENEDDAEDEVGAEVVEPIAPPPAEDNNNGNVDNRNNDRPHQNGQENRNGAHEVVDDKPNEADDEEDKAVFPDII